ncbi:hypothetical protein ACWDSD_27185 [Streptomyces spiralis]
MRRMVPGSTMRCPSPEASLVYEVWSTCTLKDLMLVTDGTVKVCDSAEQILIWLSQR